MFGKNKFNYTGVVLSFVAGTLTGAIVGLLFAPMPGRRMQKKVGKITDKAIDDLQDTVRRMAA